MHTLLDMYGVYMCVCVCARVCVCLLVCVRDIHKYIRTSAIHILLYVHTCMHYIPICAYIQTCIHTYIYVYVIYTHTPKQNMHAYVDVRTYIRTYIHTYILTYLLTYTHTCTYVHVVYMFICVHPLALEYVCECACTYVLNAGAKHVSQTHRLLHYPRR